jgi:LPXTG-motif cell wall-anchored protein
VFSDRSDHTSLLRFIERWSFAIGRPAPIPLRDPVRQRPGLSAWRREIVGDLTGALDLTGSPDPSVPEGLLAIVPNRASPSVLSECTVTGTIGSLSSHTAPIVQDPPVPSQVSQPTQERFTGRIRRPGVACAPSPAATSTSHRRPAKTVQGKVGARTLPATGRQPTSVTWTATGLLAAGLIALRRRRHSG